MLDQEFLGASARRVRACVRARSERRRKEGSRAGLTSFPSWFGAVTGVYGLMTGLPLSLRHSPSLAALTTSALATVNPLAVPSGKSNTNRLVLWLYGLISLMVKLRNSSGDRAAGALVAADDDDSVLRARWSRVE